MGVGPSASPSTFNSAAARAMASSRRDSSSQRTASHRSGGAVPSAASRRCAARRRGRGPRPWPAPPRSQGTADSTTASCARPSSPSGRTRSPGRPHPSEWAARVLPRVRRRIVKCHDHDASGGRAAAPQVCQQAFHRDGQAMAARYCMCAAKSAGGVVTPGVVRPGSRTWWYGQDQRPRPDHARQPTHLRPQKSLHAAPRRMSDFTGR